MTTILKIDGMSCRHCVKHVTDALTEVNGVHNVEVCPDNKTATVEHDETVTAAQMKKAVEEAGYEVK